MGTEAALSDLHPGVKGGSESGRVREWSAEGGDGVTVDKLKDVGGDFKAAGFLCTTLNLGQDWNPLSQDWQT